MTVRLTRRAALAGAAVLSAPALVRAQPAPLKIGMITTLSGPGGYLGQDIRDQLCGRSFRPSWVGGVDSDELLGQLHHAADQSPNWFQRVRLATAMNDSP